MNNATKLRAALKKPGALKVVGAHDALSARLIERAGFDGVWASGFAISASLKCIPDASFITGHTLNVDGGFVSSGLMFDLEESVPAGSAG